MWTLSGFADEIDDDFTTQCEVAAGLGIKYLEVRSAWGTNILDLSDEQLDELFALDPAAWAQEADLTEEYFARFGDRLPAALTDELEALRRRIAEAS